MTAAPLHQRIRTEMESRILSGALGPGDKLPSELELMAHYGCSRMTVNKALSTLADAGLIQRRKRAGTVVAQRRTESMVLDVPDLAAEISRRGQAYRYQLLDRQVRRPRKTDAEEAFFSRSDRLLVISGVHLADERPFAFEERLVCLGAASLIESEDFSTASPGSWLLRHIPWTEAENRIGAIEAGSIVAEHLQIPLGSACLTIERRTWRGDESITLVRQKFVAAQYELVARFGAGQLQGVSANRP